MKTRLTIRALSLTLAGAAAAVEPERFKVILPTSVIETEIRSEASMALVNYLIRFGDVVLGSGTPRCHHGWRTTLVLGTTWMHNVAFVFTSSGRSTASKCQKVPKCC